jgi:hypothetical protein
MLILVNVLMMFSASVLFAPCPLPRTVSRLVL